MSIGKNDLQSNPTVQELIDELWEGSDPPGLWEMDEWDAADILDRVRLTLAKYDERERD